ncbi:hypothetical protein TSO352_24525 [Azospirillum sp. TSO35-2]|nr:hypothetical protein TSO352_24525 [Azospirillum sp. TSO35-2]
MPWSIIDNPGRHADFVSSVIRDEAYRIVAPLHIRNDGGYTGLELSHSAQFDFDAPVSGFELLLSVFAQPGAVEVFDHFGMLLETIPITRHSNIGRAVSTKNNIKRIFITAPSNETNCLLLRLDGVPESTRALWLDQAIPLSRELDPDVCAEVVYGETGTLRAPQGEEPLKNGRRFIAGVAYKRYLTDPTRFAPRRRPTDEELAEPTIEKHWNLCVDAANAAKGDDVKTCRHFAVWPIADDGKSPTKQPKIKDDWPYTYASSITERFGPMKSYVDPKSDKTYIFKYCGVP